jgi:hypothetical protein
MGMAVEPQPIITAKGVIVNPNNPCILRLRSRRRRLEQVKKDVDDLQWRRFRYNSKEEVTRVHLVEPILECLIAAATSFGKGNNITDFSSLFDNVDYSVPASSDYCRPFNFWRKSSFVSNVELNTEDLKPAARMRTHRLSLRTTPRRVVHVAGLKLKRLSINGSKVSDLGHRISAIKAEVAALLPETSASPFEMISMLVNSLVDMAYLRAKLHEYRRNTPSGKQIQDDETSNSEDRQDLDMRDDAALSSSKDCSMGSDSDSFSSPGPDSDVQEYFSAEETTCEKMARYFSKIDRLEPPTKSSQTDMQEMANVGTSTQSTQEVSVMTQTSDDIGIILRNIPNELKSIATIGPFLEKFDSLRSILVRLN